MRISLVVLCLAMIPALFGRAFDARTSTLHAAHRSTSANDVTRSVSSVAAQPPTEQTAPDSPAAAETTGGSSVSLHQHVDEDGGSQRGHAQSGAAVSGQVTYVDSSSVNQATSSEGARTSSPGSYGTNDSSNGHSESDSDSGN